MNKMRSMIAGLLFFCVLLWAAFPLQAQQPSAANPGVLKDIQVMNSSSGLEVRIILTGLTSYKAFELSSPTRLVLDLSGIEKVEAAPEITIGAGGILRVRSGLFSQDTGRIVFDTDGKMPRYEIVKIAEGLKVTFAPAVPPVQKDETKPVSSKDERAKPDPAKPKVEEQPPAKAAAQDQAKPAEQKQAPVADKRQMEETQRALEQTIKLYDKSIQEELDRKRRSIRVMAAGGLFFPGEGGFKDRYGSGLKFGAEINAGIADNIEIWLSASFLNQTSTDTASGLELRSGLFPVLAGLKFRSIKGLVHYYFGLGAGYFFYSETSAGITNREQEFGLAGQAGAFLKLGRNFVLGAQAEYDHCRMGSGAGRIDPGGFHIGLVVGAEF
jgi:hypothetical protein